LSAWSRCCQAIGVSISISKRQVMRLLIDGQDDDFLVETREVLRAGLATAGWITVDDAGARHRCTNGVCTQIGNDNFSWFGMTGSKSRLNFLDLLRAGHTDYTINDAALDYMREHARPEHWFSGWPCIGGGSSLMRKPGCAISSASALPIRQ